MLEDAYGKADIDIRERMLREAQVDARRLLDATQSALAQDGETLLSPIERAAILQVIYALADVIETSGPDSLKPLKHASDELNRATQDFAARRMNAGIQRALTGRNLNELETLV